MVRAWRDTIVLLLGLSVVLLLPSILTRAVAGARAPSLRGRRSRKGGCLGDAACHSNRGAVGELACGGDNACSANAGNIGKLSCRGEQACLDRRDDVGTNSCNGDFACANSGTSLGAAIGKNACNGDRACLNNTNPIANNTCNGPPVGGVGVCEQ